MTYYTLLTRDHEFDAWSIQFGDKDRETVEFERQCYCDGGYTRKTTHIIATKTATQGEIDRRVAHLNDLTERRRYGAKLTEATKRSIIDAVSDEQVLIANAEGMAAWEDSASVHDNPHTNRYLRTAWHEGFMGAEAKAAGSAR